MRNKHVIVLNIVGLSSEHLLMEDVLPNITGLVRNGFKGSKWSPGVFQVKRF